MVPVARCRWGGAVAAARPWGFPSLRAPRESVPHRVRSHTTNLGSWAFYRWLRQGPTDYESSRSPSITALRGEVMETRSSNRPQHWDQPNMMYPMDVPGLGHVRLIPLSRGLSWIERDWLNFFTCIGFNHTHPLQSSAVFGVTEQGLSWNYSTDQWRPAKPYLGTLIDPQCIYPFLKRTVGAATVSSLYHVVHHCLPVMHEWWFPKVTIMLLRQQGERSIDLHADAVPLFMRYYALWCGIILSCAIWSVKATKPLYPGSDILKSAIM
jgi:hypothetical protein